MKAPSSRPNTCVEIKGVGLAPPGDSRIWQASDFVGNTMPTQLDKVSATVNGKSAYMYYVSPAQVNILTPPNTLTGAAQVVLPNDGTSNAAFTAQAQSISPSFLMFGGRPYIAAEHLDGSLIGPATLCPAWPDQRAHDRRLDHSDGHSVAASGHSNWKRQATVQCAGLVAPGEFQLSVVVPATASNGDLTITATYGDASTQSGALLTVLKGTHGRENPL